jgi:hypothetical protein
MQGKKSKIYRNFVIYFFLIWELIELTTAVFL